MSADISISAGLTVNPRTRPLIQRKVGIEGCSVAISTFKGGSELFWRQLKFGDFDISEMSLSTLLILTNRALDEGANSDWVALPIFTSRMYFHLGVMKRSDRGIESVQDLHGKRVGVPEYQQTAAVWTRGVLSDDFGFDPQKVDWYMERVPDISHAGITGYEPPEGISITQIPPQESIGSRLLDGTLDATLRYLPNENLVDRSRTNFAPDGVVVPLFNAEDEARRYHELHQLFPINHAVAIHRSLVEEHPWIVLNVYHAFSTARDMVTEAGQRVPRRLPASRSHQRRYPGDAGHKSFPIRHQIEPT